MINKCFAYAKANGAHGSRDKQARLLMITSDLFSARRRGVAGIGAESMPTLHIGGVELMITSDFDLDMASVLP